MGVVGLSGCSLLRLTYPQLPTIAYWYIDGYTDFTSVQTPRVHEQLAEWLRWHRSTQLVNYAAALQEGRAEVLADTTADQVCRWVDQVEVFVRVGYEQGLAAAAETALTLDAAQLRHIQSKFDKVNAELRRAAAERV